MRMHFHNNNNEKNETKNTQFAEVNIFPFANEEVDKLKKEIKKKYI